MDCETLIICQLVVSPEGFQAMLQNLMTMKRILNKLHLDEIPFSNPDNSGSKCFGLQFTPKSHHTNRKLHNLALSCSSLFYNLILLTLSLKPIPQFLIPGYKFCRLGRLVVFWWFGFMAATFSFFIGLWFSLFEKGYDP